MARLTRQLASFELVVRELVPGHQYPIDRLLSLCRAKHPRFGFSTLQTFLRQSIASGAISRPERGVYVAPDSQGATTHRLAGLAPSSPLADVSCRLVSIEEGIVLATQQQALLDRKLDHVVTLLQQVLSQQVSV